MLHNDLKPSNILLDTTCTPPLAKLADFGLARTFASRCSGLDHASSLEEAIMQSPALTMIAQEAERLENGERSRPSPVGGGTAAYQVSIWVRVEEI